MKITPASLDPDSLPHGLREIQIRATRWGIVAQKRPGSPKKPPTKAQQQQRLRFGFAARMASSPTDVDLATAIAMARGTQQVPRDILTAAALGRYYRFVNADGTEWGHVPGAVVPSELGEEPTPEPTPTTEDGAEMNFNHWDAAWTTPNSSSGWAFKGGRLTPQETRTVTRAAAILNITAGGTYRFAIGTHDAGGVIQSVTLSDPAIASETGHQMVVFPMEAELTAGVEHFAMVGRTDQGPTFALPVWYSGNARWLWPCRPGHAVMLAQVEPAVGHTLNLSAVTYNPPMGFRF